MADDLHGRAVAFSNRVAHSCSSALEDAVVAVILHGSLTLGDFDAKRSDIDMLVVVKSPLSDEHLAALRDAVEYLWTDAPNRLDLRVVTSDVSTRPTRAPGMEASIAVHPGQPPQMDTRVPGEPDLVPEFSMVRTHGHSLIGPDPHTVVGVVPDEWLAEIGDRYRANWERLVDDAANAELMVLTACRIWRFSAEGIHCSKSAAGRWALARDPSLTAVAEALRQRDSDSAATTGAEGIRHLLALVRRELRARHSSITGVTDTP
jgi:predicted nucleotidyltransferase